VEGPSLGLRVYVVTHFEHSVNGLSPGHYIVVSSSRSRLVFSMGHTAVIDEGVESDGCQDSTAALSSSFGS